jgi:hypothetical protein
MKSIVIGFVSALAFLGLGIGRVGSQPAIPASGVAAPAVVPAAAATNGLGPKLQFDSMVYDFGKLAAGEMVKHSFMFTNVGNQVLEINTVQPSCGCTTAGEWTRKVEPGQTGQIPLQFNTANYSGQVMKHVTVGSNDKSQPQVALQIKGTIWRPIEITPQFAVLNLMPESPSNSPTKVRIVNNLEAPLAVWSPECNNTNFAVTLQTNQPGKEFEMSVSCLSGAAPGNVQGQITAKTSSTNMPVITITAWANVQPVVAINPPQVVLPGGPLANKMSPSVFIQNNGTNSLTLSEPSANVPGVEVQIREMVAGRSYTVALTFPQGFEVSPGHPAEVTFKSNHPKFPVLKVPIMQMPRPVAQLQGVTNRPPQPVRPALSPPAPAPVARPGIPQQTSTPPPLPPGAAAK